MTAPAGWTQLRLKYTVLSIRNGVWGDEPTGDATNVRCIRAADFDRTHLKAVPDSAPYRRLTAAQLCQNALEMGDLVLEKSGGGDTQPVGLVVLFDDAETAVCSNFAARIRVRQGFDSRYLCYLHAHLYAAGINTKSIKQNTGIQNLDAGSYFDERVDLAPSAEQRVIADFLDRETEQIDALVAKKQRLIELLQEERTAVISHTVTKGLDPEAPMKDSGIEWLSRMPAAWEVRRLKQLTEFVTSGSRGWAEFYADEGPIFIRITNLDRKSVDLELSNVQHVNPPVGSEGERTRVRAGDVLVSITADVGTVGIVPDGLGAAYVNQHTALIRPQSSSVEPRWLALALHSGVGQRQFAALLQGGTKLGLNLDDVRNLIVPVPPLADQRRLMRHIDDAGERLGTLSATVSSALERLREHRSALITAAVTGQIDVGARKARRQAERP